MDDWKSNWLAFRKLQRHGLVQMTGGLVYFCIGLSFLLAGALSPRHETPLAVALNMFSLPTWGIIFIVAGCLVVFSSIWPPINSSWGYVVLTGLASAWSAIYVLGYFMGFAPITNLVTGFVWALMAYLWWAISGLVNPDPKLRRER